MIFYSHKDQELTQLRTLSDGWDFWQFPDIVACLRRPCHHLVYKSQWEAVIFFYVEQGVFADIFFIYVDSSKRQKGHGLGLLLDLENYFRRHAKVPRILLECRADNEPALAFYKKAGFEQKGIKTNYYSADGCDAIMLSKEL